MSKSTSMTKAVALFATASIATMGLAACSSSETPAASDGDTQSVTAAPEAAGEAIEIEYLHRLPDGDGMVKVDEIVARWNEEHPDIQVKATKFDGKALEMIKKLETDINAGAAPCLAQLGYAEVPAFFTKGLVEDVTAEAEKYKDNFSGAYSLMSVGGKFVGLPQDTGPLVYFYDKAEFDALGLKVPTTLDELKEEAKKAAEKGKYILDFEADEPGYWLGGQAVAAGDTWYSATDDKWNVTIEGEGAKKVAAFWQELIDAKAVLTYNRWDDAYSKALTDKTLIGNIGAAWEAGFMLDGVVPEGQDGTWQVALLPDFGSGKTGHDGGSGVAVLKGCAHPAEAMEFNNWFNTQTKDLATQGLVVAAKGEVVTSDKIKKQFGGQDVFAELAKANETLADFAFIPGFPAVADAMAATAGKVVKGEGKVADIFTTAQEASVKTLKDLNLPVAE